MTYSSVISEAVMHRCFLGHVYFFTADVSLHTWFQRILPDYEDCNKFTSDSMVFYFSLCTLVCDHWSVVMHGYRSANCTLARVNS